MTGFEEITGNVLQRDLNSLVRYPIDLTLNNAMSSTKK